MYRIDIRLVKATLHHDEDCIEQALLTAFQKSQADLVRYAVANNKDIAESGSTALAVLLKGNKIWTATSGPSPSATHVQLSWLLTGRRLVACMLPRMRGTKIDLFVCLWFRKTSLRICLNDDLHWVAGWMLESWDVGCLKACYFLDMLAIHTADCYQHLLVACNNVEDLALVHFAPSGRSGAFGLRSALRFAGLREEATVPACPYRYRYRYWWSGLVFVFLIQTRDAQCINTNCITSSTSKDILPQTPSGFKRIQRYGQFLERFYGPMQPVDSIPHWNFSACIMFSSSISVPKMTLQEIVKQEPESKCYIDMLSFFSAFCYVLHGYCTMLPFKYHLCVRKASAWCGVGGGDFPGHGILPSELVKLWLKFANCKFQPLVLGFFVGFSEG